MSEADIARYPGRSHFKREVRSVQRTNLVHRPVSEDGFAINVAGGHSTEIAAVVGEAAVISQHKIRISWNHRVRERPLVLVGSGDVILHEELAVHVNAAIHDAHVVACNTDYALDETLRRVARVAKDHNVPALDGLDPVYELVDEDALL